MGTHCENQYAIIDDLGEYKILIKVQWQWVYGAIGNADNELFAFGIHKYFLDKGQL